MIIHVLFVIGLLALIGPIMLVVLAFNTYKTVRTLTWLSHIAATGCALFAVIMSFYFLASWLPYDSSVCVSGTPGGWARCAAYDAAAQIVESRWKYFSASIGLGVLAITFSWMGAQYAAGKTSDS